jgi:hypothetical protein
LDSFGLRHYLQQLFIPFEIFLIAALMIKQARAQKITKLSANGRMSKAAAKSSNTPRAFKTVLHIQLFLFSILHLLKLKIVYNMWQFLIYTARYNIRIYTKGNIPRLARWPPNSYHLGLSPVASDFLTAQYRLSSMDRINLRIILGLARCLLSSIISRFEPGATFFLRYKIEIYLTHLDLSKAVSDPINDI